MKKIIISIVFILLIYIYCYFIQPPYISVIQTTLNDFDFNLLLNKQPLVVGDKIKDVLVLLNCWFSPNIIQDIEFDNKRHWNINFHKYLFCYATDDTEILLYSSKHKVIDDVADDREPIIAIQLKKSQCLIIPYRWYYNIKNNSKMYGIHDYITYLLDNII